MLPLTHLLFWAFLAAQQAAASKPAPRLELNVFEADGTPARVEANDLSRWSLDGRILYCVRCPKGETPNPVMETPAGAGSNSPGRGDSVFFVEPGERYVYAYVGKDIQPIEGEVTIGMNSLLTVRELHVEPVVKTQSLRIHLVRPDLAAINHDFQVSLESLVTGLTLFRSDLQWNESRYGDVLPVGRYRVRVETEDTPPGLCANGWLPKPAPFGDWVETVDLAAGEPVQIESSLWLGGKLRLTLDIPRGDESKEERWRRQFPTQFEPQEFGWLSLGTRGPGARVTLRPDPDAPAAPRERGMPEFHGTTVRFFCMPKLMAAYGFDAILPGDEQTSADWIPPGAYIAHVEARDFAPVEANVRIEVDETTELRIKLAPR